MIVVPSSSSESLARKVADELGARLSDVERKRFPDGEMYIRILEQLPGNDVVVVGSIRSDSDFLELLFLLNASKEGGSRSVTAVIPYYGYARQHRIYKPGEPVSSKVVTKSIEEFADRIVCVEIHDPETLGFTELPFESLSVINSTSEYFRDRELDLIMSPDDGGYDRAREMAKVLGIPSYFIDKKRIDSKTVEMTLPDVDFKGKSILLVDDMISTGGTIIKAANLLKEHGANSISVCAVHGLFAKDSGNRIEEVVDTLVVTDTIGGKYSLISVAGDIAKSIAGEE